MSFEENSSDMERSKMPSKLTKNFQLPVLGKNFLLLDFTLKIGRCR